MPGVPGDLIPPGVPPQVPQQPNPEDPPSVNPDTVMSQVTASPFNVAYFFVCYSPTTWPPDKRYGTTCQLSLRCYDVPGAAFRLCICVCTSYLHSLQALCSKVMLSKCTMCPMVNSQTYCVWQQGCNMHWRSAHHAVKPLGSLQFYHPTLAWDMIHGHTCFKRLQ